MEEVESGGEKWENGISIDYSEEADDSLDVEERTNRKHLSLPAPIYP
jgi:hypothetical protein